MTKQKFRFTLQPDYGEPEQSHFFASSAAEWRTGTDIEALIAKMKKSGLNFNLFLVPVPSRAEYEIARYRPQVKGAVWIGAFLAE